MKGNALIRANFRLEPEGLSEEEWAQRFAEALWIEQWRLKNQAELLARLFGEK
jgi:hypothetical protein